MLALFEAEGNHPKLLIKIISQNDVRSFFRRCFHRNFIPGNN
jgi:hypothetical protein